MAAGEWARAGVPPANKAAAVRATAGSANRERIGPPEAVNQQCCLTLSVVCPVMRPEPRNHPLEDLPGAGGWTPGRRSAGVKYRIDQKLASHQAAGSGRPSRSCAAPPAACSRPRPRSAVVAFHSPQPGSRHNASLSLFSTPDVHRAGDSPLRGPHPLAPLLQLPGPQRLPLLVHPPPERKRLGRCRAGCPVISFSSRQRSRAWLPLSAGRP
jgi:hypothetical protein